jgi:hypothetical protein
MRELVAPEIHPLGFPQKAMQAQVGKRPAKKDQPLGHRKDARHPPREGPEKNGVCDQERNSDRGIEEDSHAQVPVVRINLWNKTIIYAFPGKKDLFTKI